MRLSFADYDPRRIALVKPSALGDIVHALPVLHALRQRYPSSHITWIVNRAYEPLLQGQPDLDAVLAFDRGAARSGWWKGTCGFVRFLKAVREGRFDLVVDLQGLLRTGLMAWASRAPRRVGLRSAREGAACFYTDVVNDLDRRDAGPTALHAVDRYWLVAEALGVGHVPKRFHLPMDVSERRWASSLVSSRPRPWLTMNVGTRWETKRWPAEHFAALAGRAIQAFGGTVVLVGGPDETQHAKIVQAALPHQSLDLTGQTSLRQLVAILSLADVMISNDSGPLHIADALGRPVVAPYTCTSPARTGPYNQMQGAVATTVWCAASYLKKCGRMECVTELLPERLWPVLEEHLRQWQRRSA